MATALIPKFKLTFDIQAGTLDFTDESTNRDAATYGTPRITHVDSATILYTGSGWDPTTPTWVSPPINGSTSTWVIADIPIPTDYNGQYKVEYWTKKGIASATLVTRTYNLDYTAPVVEIDLTVLCPTSQLTSEDSTDYNIVVAGVQYTPSMSRTHTITKPAGSGYTGTLSWVDAGTISTRTIGGGSTAVTRLWTRVWQTNIISVLTFTLSSWGATNMGVILVDTVYGDDNTFAQCDATICALAQCYANLLTRWMAALTVNFAYKEDKRDIVIQASALWDQLLWYERCGTDTTSTILALQVLLAGENCDCTSVDDEVSVPIVPWSAMAGSGITASDFVFYIEPNDPASDLVGTNGDLHLNSTSDDIFKKVGGTWGTAVANIKGPTGAAGSDATQTVSVLLNDSTDRSTPAGTGITQISYDFQINNSQFTLVNDYMEFEWNVLLAKNQRGKLLTVRYAGSDITTYFADDMVIEENERVIVKLIVNPVSDTAQHLTAQVTRAGEPGEVLGPIVERNFGCDLNITRSVALYGTNSEAYASDIICDKTLVVLYHRDSVLIPPGIPLSTGRGLVSQTFIATEGQTEFTVTAFEPNDYYIPLIDNVVQDQLIVTRSGYIFTYAPGLTAGQVLTIVD